jgi:hypothetical protein
LLRRFFAIRSPAIEVCCERTLLIWRDAVV